MIFMLLYNLQELRKKFQKEFLTKCWRLSQNFCQCPKHGIISGVGILGTLPVQWSNCSTAYGRLVDTELQQLSLLRITDGS